MRGCGPSRASTLKCLTQIFALWLTCRSEPVRGEGGFKQMKIVIAPDSFKESLTAEVAARAMAAGFREAWPDAEIVMLPMADGGEGTTEAVVSATGGRMVGVTATGPLGRPVECAYGVTADGWTAVVELAAASGLERLAVAERNPLATTSFGTGELMMAALACGPKRMLLGLGGSATVDGGVGLMQALGAKFVDKDGRDLERGGGALRRLQRVDLNGVDARWRDVAIDVACDVDNPLTGPQGAAATFGPQKGATAEMVKILEAGLVRLAEVLSEATGVDVAKIEGGGAAGGVSAALVACLGAKLRPGAKLVAEIVGLEDALRDADVVVTGEGRMDGQSLHGKTPMGVAEIAKRHGKPVVALAGAVTADAELLRRHGVDVALAIVPGAMALEEALAGAEENLRMAARNVAMLLRLGCGLMKVV